MTNKKKPEKIKNVLIKIKECVEKGHYFVTAHAFIRQNERMISLLESLYVLTTGHEEKKENLF